MKLRPLEPEDLELLYTIENDPTLWSVSGTNVPYSHYDLRNYITNQQHDIYADKQLRLVICDDDDSAVGLIDLFNYSPEHNRAEMGIAILRSKQGKGYSQRAIAQLHEYVCTTLFLNQIYCIVPENNKSSLRMLECAGYTSVATLPQWLKIRNGYINCFLFSKSFGAC